MKKILVVITGLLIVTACGSVEADKEERFTNRDRNLNITVDKETNCKYMVYYSNSAGGITPLLKKDGTPDCE